MFIISLLDKFTVKEAETSHLLICKSLSHLLRAEKLMQAKGITVNLIPVPRGFGSPCRSAAVFPTPFKEQVDNLLTENNIAWQGIYPLEPPPRKEDWSEVWAPNLSAEFLSIMAKAQRDEQLTGQDIVRLLQSNDQEELGALFKAADLVRRECVGERVDIRGAIEFSNYCRKNCLYCGLRRDNKELPRYRMTPDEILAGVAEIANMGLRTVILQSGEDPWYTKEIIIKLIKEIKAQFGLRITLSLGERDPDELLLFREAGANNYLLKIETADEEFFRLFHPDDYYEERLENLKMLKQAGFLVGSGNIVGLPGQTLEHLAQDVIFHKERGIHMIGTGPFIPAQNTPLAGAVAGSVEMTLKLTALYRLVCQNVYLPATTALATLDGAGLAKGLQAGANTIMLIMTPSKYRAQYNIYNAKKPVDLAEAMAAISVAGRKLPYYLEKKGLGGSVGYAGNT